MYQTIKIEPLQPSQITRPHEEESEKTGLIFSVKPLSPEQMERALTEQQKFLEENNRQDDAKKLAAILATFKNIK